MAGGASSKTVLRLGTRGSKLALWQAEYVKSRLEKAAGVPVEIVKIKTSGDKILDVPLAKIGGKGLFVKEIEVQLATGGIDLAVHSMKDMPTELPEGLVLAATFERADPRDVLISRGNVDLMSLPAGSRVGTSSLRRRAQLKHLRPDVEVVDVRGNLDTRLRKIAEGQMDAIILAAAGIDRMGWSGKITERISSDLMLSAVGQGAIAVEAREDDARVLGILEELNHEPTMTAVRAERALMRVLEGGCQVPVGGLARVDDGTLVLDGLVADLDGERLVRDRVEGAGGGAEELGEQLAEKLLAAGGREILGEIRAAAGGE